MEAPVQKILEAVGDRNRYQYIAFTILFVYNGFSNLMMVGPTFIFMNPLFTCNGVENLSEAEACPILDQCVIGSIRFTKKVTSPSQPGCSSTVTSRSSEMQFNLSC